MCTSLLNSLMSCDFDLLVAPALENVHSNLSYLVPHSFGVKKPYDIDRPVSYTHLTLPTNREV